MSSGTRPQAPPDPIAPPLPAIKRILIETDGTFAGTKVTDPDTGQEYGDVRRVVLEREGAAVGLTIEQSRRFPEPWGGL